MACIFEGCQNLATVSFDLNLREDLEHVPLLVYEKRRTCHAPVSLS